jgi:hypothetical protein
MFELVLNRAMAWRRTGVMVMGALLIGACGGGSSSGSDASSYGVGSTNAKPTLDLAATLQVDENQSTVTTVTAADADGDDLSFSLSGEDANALSIDNDGVLSFVSAPDYEAKASYSVTVEVSDGVETTVQSITIEIVDLDEAAPNSAPRILGLDAAVQVYENQSRLLTLEVSDADDDALSFSLEGTDAAAFEVSDGGAISFVTAPDYEAQASYELTVVVSDGVEETRQQVVVEIKDVAEAVAEAPVEFNLVVARGTNGYGTGNKYSINDNISPDLSLEVGQTYRFLQSDGTNATHPVYFSETANGIHAGGVEFTEGVSRVSSSGTAGAYVQITIPEGLTTLYYYCLNHSGMGGAISISAATSGVYVVPMN